LDMAFRHVRRVGICPPGREPFVGPGGHAEHGQYHEGRTHALTPLPIGALERALAYCSRHFPVNAGGRFSRKWATPSRKSALPKLFIISTLATSVASPSVWNSAS